MKDQARRERHKNSAPGKIIGHPTQRLEGPDKVSGRAVYAADVVLPGMLWAKVLRSPIAYGRIKKIDTNRAAALPGVAAVATGEDVKGRLIGRKIYDMPILAEGVVRFAGEKVAAVAAESEEIAEAALELIDVEYEEFEPLLDPLAAARARCAAAPSAGTALSRVAASHRCAEQCLCRYEVAERRRRSRF